MLGVIDIDPGLESVSENVNVFPLKFLVSTLEVEVRV
jgi:hypothetical protein